MARVQVADDVWADFRAAAGQRSLSEVLGELVTREVDRYRSRRLRAGQLDPREIAAALEYASKQQADLAVIVERLERLHRVGGSDTRGVPGVAPVADELAGEGERASSSPAAQPRAIFRSPMERGTPGAGSADDP
jgi:predicted CopG family antitoxin